MRRFTKLGIKLVVVPIFLVVSSGVVFGQQSDRCTVMLMDKTGVKSEEQEPVGKSKELGSFDTVISEEELTTKSFRLPRTKLYVVASVFSTDESMAGDDSQDSVALQLSISRTPKRDIFSAVQFGEAEVLLKNFEVARVTTMYKTGQQSLFLVMECRRQAAPKK